MATTTKPATRVLCGAWSKQPDGILIFNMDGVECARVTPADGHFAVHFAGQLTEANLVRDTEREAIEAVADLVSFGACDVQ